MTDLQALLRITCMEIWSTMFELALRPNVSDGTESWGWWSRVELHGAWEGSITLHFGELLGAILRKSMLGINVEDQTEDDIIDVLSELANITGGNFKPHLGSPTSLSSPAAGPLLSEPDLSFATTVLSFQTLGQPVQVMLCQHA